jgi:hypothetical protein
MVEKFMVNAIYQTDVIAPPIMEEGVPPQELLL